MKRLILAFTVGLMAVLPFALPAEAWTSGTSSRTAEATLASLIAREHDRGCAPFALRAYQHNNVDRWRAKDMVVRNYFSHTVKGTSRRVFDYFAKYGNRDWLAAGEIIAWNTYSDSQSPEQAFKAFMGSPSHRAVIKSCTYNTYGVGSYKGSGKRMFVVTFSKQPVETVRKRTGVRVSPYWGSTIRHIARYGDRQYIFRHSRGFDFGWVRGRGWGWVYDGYTR